MRGINLAKRGTNSDLGKMIIKDTMDFVSMAYNSPKNRRFPKKKGMASRSMPQYIGDSGDFYN